MGYKTICKDCGKHKPVSSRGICLNCAMKRVKKTQQELKDHKGASWEKWKKGIKKCIDKPSKKKEIKVCPVCKSEQRKYAKRCNICKFPFRDYSQASKTA